MLKEEKLINILRNIIVYVIEFIGLFTIFSAFPYNLKHIHMFDVFFVYFLKINHVLSVSIGILLILLGYALHKRLKIGRYAILIILPILISISFLKIHKVFNLLIILEIIIFLIMFYDKEYYTRSTNPLSLKKSIILILLIFIIIITNTAIGLYVLRYEYRGINDLYNAFFKSIELLFLMDNSFIIPKTKIAKIFINSDITLNWICIFSASILFIQPLIYTPLVTLSDKKKLRKLVNKYVDNPITYLSLEKDKKYFFAKNIEGAVSYTIANSVAVCCGDPICDKKDIYILLSEFISYCKDNDLDICFCQASDKYLDDFLKMNFGYVKYGEEAMFKLENYELSGKKASKVRYAVNHADKIGINIIEYEPNKKRDIKIENEITSVSKEWLSFKKSGELSFMLGGIGLEDPMDKRYFLAYDSNSILQGFVVFTPFSNKKGYHADVTRRKHDAPIGVMEKIIISAFKKMKEEGVEYGSLGLAPLANILNEAEKPTVTEKVLDYIYENMNNFYGFKTLYHYKKNYGPTDWITRYLVYYPKRFTPQIAYSIIKAQNPKGVKDYIFSRVKNIFLKNKEIEK